MASNFNNKNDPWEFGLDVDDSDLHLTPVLRSSSSTLVEPSPLTPNPFRIIPGPAGIVQLSSSTRVEPSSSTPNPVRIIPGPADGALMSTQEYMQKVVEGVDEDDDFKSGAWVSATNYVTATGGTITGYLGDIKNFLKKGKLDEVVAIVKSCSPNDIGDLNVTMKDLSGTIPGTIHHKIIGDGCDNPRISVQCLAWMLLLDLCEDYLPVPVMAISVISISSDSSEDSVGTPAGRWTPYIAPTIPPSPDYTPASPDYSPASDSESDPSSDHIPPLPAISPFLSSDDDTTDSDTPDTPPSPTHGTPFTEITASTQRSPIIPRRRVMILSPGQPIPHGRPYRYHLNGPVHMMTARKRVGPLPTHRLAVRHSADHSLSDYFSQDDSARDSFSDLSSEASSDFHSDASPDSLSGHSLSDHYSPDLPSTSAGPSRKRRRSSMTSVPALPPVFGALSPVRADLIPSPKRVKDFGYLADVEVDPKEISLRDDAIIRVSDEPHLEQDIDPEIQAEIDECIAYADALRDRGIDARVVVEEGAVEVTYETLGDLVQRFHDHTQAIPVHRIQAIEGVQREQGHRIVRVESAVIALTKRIAELERDNRRLRGTASVESQRVDRLQRGMSRMQRELRQMRRLQFYDRVRVGRLEACARKHMGYRP
ncbi:retrovirus-related pol polyprotein from transposon 17.6 [Tanacetum coccineum]